MDAITFLVIIVFLIILGTFGFITYTEWNSGKIVGNETKKNMIEIGDEELIDDSVGIRASIIAREKYSNYIKIYLNDGQVINYDNGTYILDNPQNVIGRKKDAKLIWRVIKYNNYIEVENKILREQVKASQIATETQEFKHITDVMQLEDNAQRAIRDVKEVAARAAKPNIPQ